MNKHVKVTEIEKVPLFLDPTEEVISLIKEGYNTYKDNYLTLIKRKPTTLWYYRSKRYTVPIHVVRETCKLLNRDFMGFMDNKKIYPGSHSKRCDIFSVEKLSLNSYRSLILGCIPTEAHLCKSNINVQIAQNTIEPLNIIQQLIYENYENVSKENVFIKSTTVKGIRYPLLIIKSPFLRWLFQDKYNIKEGRGARERLVPRDILSSEETILGFLGGVFSLEAGFSVYHQNDRYDTVLSLEMSSLDFVEDVRRILIERGYEPTGIRKDRDCWYFKLCKDRDIVKLLYEISPWFIHRPKLLIARKSDRAFLDVLKEVIDKKTVKDLDDKTFAFLEYINGNIYKKEFERIRGKKLLIEMRNNI